MFSAIQSFVSQHKRKFIFGGIIIGGAIVLSDYAKRVLKKSQEINETRELLERNKKQQHYECTEGICNETALTISSSLNGIIAKSLNTEIIVECLKGSASNKIKLWEELKILSFTKVTVLVYANSLLMIILRIQLNLIGGYMFRDNIDENKQLDINCQNKYMTLYQFFLEHGISKLITLIKTKVNIVLKYRSLKDLMTIKDIEKFFWAIQSSIEKDSKNPCKTLPEYLMPARYRDNKNLIFEEGKVFDQLIKETHDILEMNEIQSLSLSAIDCGFKFAVDKLTDNFRQKDALQKQNQKRHSEDASTSATDNEFSDLSDIKIPLAKVIPILNDLVPNTPKRNSFANQLMKRLVMMDSLKVMGANVYELFSSKS